MYVFIFYNPLLLYLEEMEIVHKRLPVAVNSALISQPKGCGLCSEVWKVLYSVSYVLSCLCEPLSTRGFLFRDFAIVGLDV